jgi:hypothetical protein
MLIAIKFVKFHKYILVLKLKEVRSVDQGVCWDIMKLKG